MVRLKEWGCVKLRFRVFSPRSFNQRAFSSDTPKYSDFRLLRVLWQNYRVTKSQSQMAAQWKHHFIPSAYGIFGQFNCHGNCFLCCDLSHLLYCVVKSKWSTAREPFLIQSLGFNRKVHVKFTFLQRATFLLLLSPCSVTECVFVTECACTWVLQCWKNAWLCTSEGNIFFILSITTLVIAIKWWRPF